MAPLRLAQEHERKLVRKYLVVGEPLPRFPSAGLTMNERKGRTPAAPGFARGETGFDPLGKIGSPFQRLPGKVAHAPVGQSFGERINRLPDGGRRSLPRLGNFRMDDLPLVAIRLELARNDALLSHREAALRPARIVEIDQADRVPVLIRGEHAHRSAAGSVLAGLIGCKFQNHVVAEQGGARRRSLDAFDGPGRKMVQHIDHAGQVEALEQLGDLRPHAFQNLRLGEQWIEGFRAHCGFGLQAKLKLTLSPIISPSKA